MRYDPLRRSRQPGPVPGPVLLGAFSTITQELAFPNTTRILGGLWKHTCSSPADLHQLQTVLFPANTPNCGAEGQTSQGELPELLEPLLLWLERGMSTAFGQPPAGEVSPSKLRAQYQQSWWAQRASLT